MRSLFYLTFSLLIFSFSTARANDFSFDIDEGDTLQQFKLSDDNKYHFNLPQTTHDTYLVISLQPEAADVTLSLQDSAGDAIPFKCATAPRREVNETTVSSDKTPLKILANLKDKLVTIVIASAGELALKDFSAKSVDEDSFEVRHFGKTKKTPRKRRTKKRGTPETRFDKAIAAMPKAPPARTEKIDPDLFPDNDDEWDDDDSLYPPINVTYPAFTPKKRSSSKKKKARTPQPKARTPLSPKTAQKRAETERKARRQSMAALQSSVSARRIGIYGSVSPTSKMREFEQRRHRPSLSPSSSPYKPPRGSDESPSKVKRKKERRQHFDEAQAALSALRSPHTGKKKKRSKRRVTITAGAGAAGKMGTPESSPSSSSAGDGVSVSTTDVAPRTPVQSQAARLSDIAIMASASPQKKLNRTTLNEGWSLTGCLEDEHINFRSKDHLDIDFSESTDHQGASLSLNIEPGQTHLIFAVKAKSYDANCYFGLYETTEGHEEPVELTLHDDKKCLLSSIPCFAKEQEFGFTAEIDPDKKYRLIFFKDESPRAAKLTLKDLSYEYHKIGA